MAIVSEVPVAVPPDMVHVPLAPFLPTVNPCPEIVPPDWFVEATRKQKDIGQPGRGYGFQWWTYDDGSFAAQGIYGQGIFIDPQRRLIIASNSNWTRAAIGPESKARQEFYNVVRAAVDRTSP